MVFFGKESFEISKHNTPFEEVNIEIDESYFGAKRVRGKYGQGARGKTKVFGILKRQWGSIYT